MAVLALPVVLLKSASVPSAVLPLELRTSGAGMSASEETNENKPVTITTNVLFKTVRRALLRVAPCKIPSTAVFFRVLYVQGLSALAPLPESFISHFLLRKRCIEVRSIFSRYEDFTSGVFL